MRAVGAEIGVVHYSAAIRACGQGRRWQLALGLLAEMPFVKVDKNVVTYSAAISACERASSGSWPWGCWRRGPLSLVGAVGGDGV